MVSELLPGPQDPWDVSEPLKQYYETGVYQTADDTAKTDVQVEMYSMSDYEKLNSLFDSYDLMMHAKSSNGVMYMTLPRSSRLAELRKKISLWKSAGGESVGPERVRLWHIGHTRAQSGSALALDLITDLNVPLDSSGGTLRFWMETISEGKSSSLHNPYVALKGRGLIQVFRRRQILRHSRSSIRNSHRGQDGGVNRRTVRVGHTGTVCLHH